VRCDSCPFNEGIKVQGEGSRILETYKEEIPTKAPGVVFKRDVVVRDNEGQYDVVIVGMAPAREEVKEGRVFVGASGQILKNTLAQMGIEEYYLCNVFLCPITEDTLVPQARECCRSVIDEIKERKPKLTIALGDLPLHTLADTSYTIREVEGRVIPSKVGPLLPLTHPAYYWRRPEEFFDFIECMRSGIRFIEGRYEQAVEPTLEVVTHENYKDVLNELDRHDKVAIDLETTGFNAYGWEPDEIMEMGIAVSHDHAYIVPKEMIGEFKDILEKKYGIYWNAQFDCAFLKQIGISPRVGFDGMLAHYTIDERGHGHGLKRVAGIYLGCDDWEKEIGQYIPKRQSKTVSYAVIPQDVRYVYLSKDVTRTYQLEKVLEPEVNKKIFDRILMPATRMLIDIEHRGMRIDPVKLMEMEPVLTEDMEVLERELFELTGDWINPNSPPQVGNLLYKKMGLPIDPYLGPTTGKEYLGLFAGNPVVDKILEYRQLSKMRGTYVVGFARFVDHNYRIHPKINLFKTVTGRLSSSEPSIMNIKSDSRLKEIFLPDDGCVLGYGDIKGNELGWYCIESGDNDLGDILRSGGDPHGVVSAAAYGKERAKEFRTPAKAVVFGRIYKRGRKSIEMQVGSDVIDAVMEAVDNVAPNIDKYYKMILEELKRGYLDSYFGRRRRFPLITPKTKQKVEREAVNFKPQSDGSDLMLLCMLHLWEIKDKWGIWPFWPVHDSITSNMPNPNVLPEMKKELEKYAYELVDGKMPFVWEVDWGYNWAMQKEK